MKSNGNEKKEPSTEKMYKSYRIKASIFMSIAFIIFYSILYVHIKILPLQYWHEIYTSLGIIGTLLAIYGTYCCIEYLKKWN